MVPEPGLTPNTPDEQSPAQPPAADWAAPAQPPVEGWPAGQPAATGYPPSGYPMQPGFPPPGYPASGYPTQPGYPEPSGYPMQQGYPMQPGYSTPGYYPTAPVAPNGYYPPPFPAAGLRKPPALPVEPKAFHEFYRAPRFRWWKPLAAVGLLGVAWIVVSLALVAGAMVYDVSTGRLSSVFEAGTKLTPWVFTANNVSLALFIPMAVLTSWLVYGQRPRWLSSITGGFRWGLFGQFALIAVVPLLISLFVDGVGELAWNADSLFLIVAIVLTTPFQAAGEEYMARGLLARSVGSWFTSRWLGFVVATVVSSLVFMGLHVAGDPWLNLFYFTFGVIACVVTWRTGGLEAAIALHVVNNLIGEITLPFGGLEHMMDRQAGVAGPGILIQVGMIALVGALMCWWARRRKLSTTATGLVEGASSELS